LKKIISQFKNISLLVVLALSLSACGSHYGAAKIITEPAGATIINPVDDTVLGVTPATLTWKNPNNDRKHIPIRLVKSGFYEKTTSFWLKMTHRKATSAEKKPDTVSVVLSKKGA
jgi:hypothetical protein